MVEKKSSDESAPEELSEESLKNVHGGVLRSGHISSGVGQVNPVRSQVTPVKGQVVPIKDQVTPVRG